MNAFEAELIGLIPRLRSFATGLALDPIRADDLVQAACERALQRRAQWQPGTRLDSWMFTIVRNLWVDQLRAAGTRAEDPLPEHDLPAPAWTASIEASMTLQQVLELLARLPPDMRAVMVAVCVEDLSYKEAAEVLGIPVGTVMSRLARARSRLQSMLGGPA